MKPPYLSKYSDGRTVLVCKSGNRLTFREDEQDSLDATLKWDRSPNNRDYEDMDILDSPKGDTKGKHG